MYSLSDGRSPGRPLRFGSAVVAIVVSLGAVVLLAGSADAHPQNGCGPWSISTLKWTTTGNYWTAVVHGAGTWNSTDVTYTYTGSTDWNVKVYPNSAGNGFIARTHYGGAGSPPLGLGCGTKNAIEQNLTLMGPQSSNQRKYVMAHEFGHVLGASHASWNTSNCTGFHKSVVTDGMAAYNNCGLVGTTPHDRSWINARY